MASRGPRRTSSPNVTSREGSAPVQPRRRGKKTADASSTPAAPQSPGQHDLIVHPDPLRQKLNALTKEHDKLLREITKKRAQLSAAESLVRELASSLAAQTESIKQRLFAGVAAIQTLFKELLSPASRLNRRDKAKVRRVYEEIAEMFDLDINEDEPEDFDFGFGADVPPPRGQSKGHHHYRDVDHGGGGYSAHKPSQNNASTLRALFRKLAIAFHPDKVQDEAAKAERTSLMKDMTRAYETGDLARLMEMERALLVHLPASDAGENVSQRMAELTKVNAELRRQSRALTSELKLVSLSLPLEVNLKAPNAAELAAIEIAGLVEALEREERRVTAVRDFISEFAQGKMSVAAFLAGPTLPNEASDEEDEFELLQEDILMEFIDEFVRKAQQSQRGGGRRKPTKRK